MRIIDGRTRRISAVALLLTGILASSISAQAAVADSGEECAPRTVPVAELAAHEQSADCDLTGWVAVFDSGVTLVVPDSGVQVSTSSSDDGTFAPQPDTALYHATDGSIAALEEDVVVAASESAKVELEQAKLLASSAPKIQTDLRARLERSATADADPLRSQLMNDASAVSAVPAGKCDESAPYALYSPQLSWSSHTYGWFFNANGQPTPPDGLSHPLSRIQQAASTVQYGVWDCPEGRLDLDLALPFAGQVSTAVSGVTSTGCGSADGNSLVGFGNLTGGTLGRTCSWTAPLSVNYYGESEIKFDNSSRSWYLSHTTTAACSGAYDLYTVAAHEFGHAVGLNHVSDTTQMMRPTTPACNFDMRFMGKGDRKGLISLYGLLP